MNILRNVRWGYSGDGMACGPCCGFDAVELVVEQEEEKLTFFRLDCMDQYAGRALSLFPDQGIKLGLLAVRVKSPNLCTTRELSL